MNGRATVFSLAALAAALGLAGIVTAATLSTTAQDFHQPGTQPQTIADPILESTVCASCHGNFDLAAEPYRRWVGSMMAQSARDPIFHAALAIAEQDAGESGELCLRCHAPGGWLAGRGTPSDGSGLDPGQGDFDGVTCHVCHRMVNPVFDAATSPSVDEQILDDLGNDAPQVEVHSAQYVIDPQDRRRGPFDLGPGFPWHEWLQSPFHQDSALCKTCHDVSNPAYYRDIDDTYKLTPTNEPHPTAEKRDEFPLERTYTEWANSVFARSPIDMKGRFGGDKSLVSTCQDCHMPDILANACAISGPERADMPRHDFNGANSWVLEAVRETYPDSETGLSDQIVSDSLARNVSMLERAADLYAFKRGGALVVRIVNQTGHKLPTGYGEGRRMWPNIRFVDGSGAVLAEYGSYDSTAAAITSGTRIYEVVHGIDDYLATLTGLPAGPSFHFVLNNAIIKDNRIPPRGHTNTGAQLEQIQPVGYAYAEGRYWDELTVPIPENSVTAEISLYHQTTSREYIEFLRDENETNDTGDLAYALWEQFGKSAPVLMATTEMTIDAPECPPPLPYGLGSENTENGRATTSWLGTPSATTQDFRVTLNGALPNRPGVMVFGPNSVTFDFSGGSLLVQPQLTAPMVTDGNGEATVPVTLAPGMVGGRMHFQFIYSDPSDGNNFALSDALHVDICQ